MKTCYFCITGKLEKKNVDILRYWGKVPIAIKNVPALVCEQCGEKYFSPQTEREIDKQIKKVAEKKAKIIETLNVPVVSL